MSKVIACIDGSRAAAAVRAAAAKKQQQRAAAQALRRLLEKSDIPAEADISANIGLGGREHLLDDLEELDRKPRKLMLEQCRVTLPQARPKVEDSGLPA